MKIKWKKSKKRNKNKTKMANEKNNIQEENKEQTKQTEPNENINEQEEVKDEKKQEKSESEKTDEKQDEKSLEEKLQEEITELKDKYLRLSAEYDNYRKRTLREKMELTKSANSSVLLKLLPIVDNFERGLKSVETAEDINAVKEGMILIYNHFKEMLKQNGVKEIEAVNKEFDTDLHEAVTKIPAPEEELKGKVVDVIEKGYLLNETVLRYSKVVIGE